MTIKLVKTIVIIINERVAAVTDFRNNNETYDTISNPNPSSEVGLGFFCIHFSNGEP